MIEKKHIINALFAVSFTIYGIGSYISASVSPTFGFIISLTPFLAILLYYTLDLISRGVFVIRVNGWYLVMVLYLLSTAGSFFVAFSKNLPEINLPLVMARSCLVFFPFQAFVVVHLYNDRQRDLARMTFISLSLLLFANLIGYFLLGLENKLHSIEGRLSLPFADGFYSGSSLVAVISAILLSYFKKAKENLWLFTGWVLYFAGNMSILFYVNSRLTILILLLVFALQLFHLIEKSRLIFWASVLTIPILLSGALLLFQIISLPIFSSILQRVDFIDVTTFNGRAFLWKDALDWALYDQRGLLLGNGFRGHYFLNLITDVAKLWNEKYADHLHLHSTALEILVSQGLLGYGMFLAILYKLFRYFQKSFRLKETQGVFFPAVVFLLFILQVDEFVYAESLGALIFTCLFAFAVMRRATGTTTGNPEITLKPT